MYVNIPYMDGMGYVLDTKKDPTNVFESGFSHPFLVSMLDFWGVHASDESEFNINEFL